MPTIQNQKMSKKLVDISVLGLTDGFYTISKTEDVIYQINSSAKVLVKDGINATILDNSVNANVYVKTLKGSYLKYEILSSNDTNRQFDVDGELFVNEITFAKTNEELNISLNLENANANVNNLVLANDNEMNFIQYVDHKMNKTLSNVSNVGVAIKNSKITFDTTGKIEKKMSRTNCRQLSRGMILDDDSIIKSKPILLIDEYDCFASHGAAIGKLRDEDLFYLMSRGLNKNDAFLLILEGIIKPFIDNISLDDLKDKVLLEVKKLIEK